MVTSLQRLERTGYAEAVVARRCLALGHIVSRPWLPARYDLLVDTGSAFVRIQVKAAYPVGGKYKANLRFSGGSRTAPRNLHYDASIIDVFAIHLIEHDACYVLPVECAAGRTELTLDPDGKTRTKIDLELFREAWWRLDRIARPLRDRPLDQWNTMSISLDKQQRGNFSEVAVLTRLLAQDFNACVPWGQARYDLVVDTGSLFRRAQIKTVYPEKRTGGHWLSLQQSDYLARNRLRVRVYHRHEIDFVVGYAPGYDAAFVVPMDHIPPRQFRLRVWLDRPPYRSGPQRLDMEYYRENWDLLRQPFDELPDPRFTV